MDHRAVCYDLTHNVYDFNDTINVVALTVRMWCTARSQQVDTYLFELSTVFRITQTGNATIVDRRLEYTLELKEDSQVY